MKFVGGGGGEQRGRTARQQVARARRLVQRGDVAHACVHHISSDGRCALCDRVLLPERVRRSALARINAEWTAMIERLESGRRRAVCACGRGDVRACQVS